MAASNATAAKSSPTASISSDTPGGAARPRRPSAHFSKGSSMQASLFKALQSIKIDDDTATAVVDDLEDDMGA